MAARLKELLLSNIRVVSGNRKFGRVVLLLGIFLGTTKQFGMGALSEYDAQHLQNNAL
jgi:hypothetical protein